MSAVVEVMGAQRPRVCSVPPYVSSAGPETIELAAMAGLYLDDWQQYVIVNAMGERVDGKWSAFEVGVHVSRQNGKGGILEARELGGLFLLDERLIQHSSHQFDTSLEAFRRLLDLIEGRDEFTKRVKRVSKSHGEEGIELYGPAGRRVSGGQRIRFRTRTKGGGRGFSGDTLIFDEDMMLPVTSVAALLPTLSARPNPQVWYMGSAVDQTVHEHGLVAARIRARGLRGDDPSLAYFEWSAADAVDEDGKPVTPESLDEDFLRDEDAWAEANPGLGIRISAEYVDNERASLDDRSFAVERLGVGDWPATDGTGSSPISVEEWKALTDAESEVIDPVCFSFDVSPDRSFASISGAGRRVDERFHVEVIDRRRGTGWVVARIAELKAEHHPAAIFCDAAGPAASLVHELEKLGIEVECVTAKEHANACGFIFDLVEQDRVRHLGTAELVSALRGAAKRPLGDAWAWARKSSSVDITPLVSATLALWAASTVSPAEPWAGSW